MNEVLNGGVLVTTEKLRVMKSKGVVTDCNGYKLFTVSVTKRRNDHGECGWQSGESCPFRRIEGGER